MVVQNIYGVMPPPLEENHEAIDNLNTNFLGIKTQSYDLERLAQANAVLTSSNSAVMAQFSHMAVKTNAMQSQLNTLS